MIERTQNEHTHTHRRNLSPLKIASLVGFVIGAFVLAGVLAFLLFPDPFVNGFIKPRLTAALVEAYPAYSIRIARMKYSLWQNSFSLDSVALNATNGTFTSTTERFSVSGIGWMHLLWGGSLAPRAFDKSVVEARAILLSFTQSQYELRCGLLRLSVADSEMVADAVALHPAVDDELIFAESKFRQTRVKLTTKQCRLTGAAYLDALDRKSYRARSVQILDMCLDILINKDKPAAKDSLTPRMPNELLSSMRETIRCDVVEFVNGALMYGERFHVGSKPAVITFDKMQVGMHGIATRGNATDTVGIRAHGEFMKSGTTEIVMSIPLALSEFSLQYSGSLRGMDLRALNPFVEIAEQLRIKSGTLLTAAFHINVVAGRADGSVRAVYRNLTLAAINKHTGSEKGFVDGIASYIANTYKIRSSNVPDDSGSIEIGEVNYFRQRDDPFFRFVWFALRSGVGDVVGF